MGWSSTVVALLLLLLVLRAFLYRQRYLKVDKFDNVYLSRELRRIDNRRGELEKETIFPLTFREKLKYVPTFSLRMGSTERRKLVKSIVLLVISACQMAYYLLLDYSLWWLVKLMRYHGYIKYGGRSTRNVDPFIVGKGIMANLFRFVLKNLGPLAGDVPAFDTSKCLPAPISPDLYRYQQIGIMYCISCVLAITECYGLRLRHIVAGCYYPQRRKFRAVWLYNHILRTRGTLKKFIRRKLRRKYEGDDTRDDVTVAERMAAQFPILGTVLKAFGLVQKFCLSCGQPGKKDDMKKFKHCSSPGCKAVYCLPCFGEINNLCTVCMKPVDYGDLSDISEERDSSEEEEEARLKAKMEKFTEEDFQYQYEDRPASDSESDYTIKWRDVEAQKPRDLAKISILDSDSDVSV